jgi:hypothetical protein
MPHTTGKYEYMKETWEKKKCLQELKVQGK